LSYRGSTRLERSRRLPPRLALGLAFRTPPPLLRSSSLPARTPLCSREPEAPLAAAPLVAAAPLAAAPRLATAPLAAAPRRPLSRGRAPRRTRGRVWAAQKAAPADSARLARTPLPPSSYPPSSCPSFSLSSPPPRPHASHRLRRQRLACLAPCSILAPPRCPRFACVLAPPRCPWFARRPVEEMVCSARLAPSMAPAPSRCPQFTRRPAEASARSVRRAPGSAPTPPRSSRFARRPAEAPANSARFAPGSASVPPRCSQFSRCPAGAQAHSVRLAPGLDPPRCARSRELGRDPAPRCPVLARRPELPLAVLGYLALYR
jgi:hypothetical protein